ncbi:acyl-CoA dehydrogenase family protein [[Mycobacterium] vasticus]|uniref:Acyl-CoA dehydrogenase family protein n=1 Tax=[Mycobacterium] vasticus TaxID=2875777 RepID=A0ABU5YZX0_9MYCO|nr:acyl-CoA dehydrogenase family protein [Mycolicibacter sp. MYC017]MEB3070689.1 acyl-CoA dehydrogenase family protein [Mycolicibacter sp. MYC017]
MSSDGWRERLREVIADFRRRQEEAKAKAKADGGKIDRIEAVREWQAELVDNGLAGPGWPTSAGGMELSLEDQLDYYRMTSAAGMPAHPSMVSFILAPVLIKFGTQQQKDRFLRPLLRADEFWCQGFSEPGAGSDLASLSTRAVRDGDVYRVSGQKVWTTGAERADWMFALVRTGAPGRGSDGITYLLISMHSPGVTVRPLRDISGGAHFAEVFFDDVEVPVENVVGEEGKGWSIMRTSLGHERATAFLADEFKHRRTVDQVIDLLIAQGLDTDPLVRQEIGRMESGARAIAANSARALAAVLRGEDPGGVASVNRLVKSEFEQQMHTLALRAEGPYAMLGSRAPHAVDGGRWTFGYLKTRASTIGAGTAEIQRNTIAESVLGLPSHRGEGTRTAAVQPGAPLAVSDPSEAELREVLGKALDARVNVEALLDPNRTAESGDPAVWSALVEFGMPGLATDESLGGAGAPPRLFYAALEEAAKALAPAPLVPSAVALEVAAAVGATAVAERIAGGAPAAFVVPLGDAGWVTEGAQLPRWSGSLNGEIPVVAGAPDAEVLLVLASSGEGEVLVSVDLGGDGVVVRAEQPLDLTATVGAVTFTDVRGEVLAEGDELRRVLKTARCKALLAVAADAIGAGARALAMAVSWAGEREQFGRKIGSFQAISHRSADMLVALEGARSQVYAAAEAEEPSEVDCMLAAAAAFEAGVLATERSIQIHGGIGFTWEHPAHLLLRRARADAVAVGRPEVLRDLAVGVLLRERKSML